MHHHCKYTVATVKRSPFGSIDTLQRTLINYKWRSIYSSDLITYTLSLLVYFVSYGWVQSVLLAVVSATWKSRRKDGLVYIWIQNETDPYFLPQDAIKKFQTLPKFCWLLICGYASVQVNKKRRKPFLGFQKVMYLAKKRKLHNFNQVQLHLKGILWGTG